MGSGPLLLPLGVLSALVFPFLVWSVASEDSLREVKLFAQAIGAALAIAGLVFQKTSGEWILRHRALRVIGACSGAALALVFFSSVANAGHVDPLVVVALLGPLALLAAGSTQAGKNMAGSILGILGLAGIFSGALAFGQRFAGLPRLPLQAPLPRFLPTALLGNPGDVAASLVIPSVALWAVAASVSASRRARILSLLGFGLVLLGIGSTESVTPILAVLAGMILHSFFDFRRRLVPLAVVLILSAGALWATGSGARISEKVRELRSGQIGRVLTQRDIGIFAAREMILRRPFLGVGPGAFSNAFVPARLLAEKRIGRRLVHLSDSAHFENAHSEALTLAAECGLPTAFLAICAFVLILFGLVLRHRASRVAEREGRAAAGTLFALMGSVAILSLGSFPLRLPAVSGSIAFVAGLALSEVRKREDESPVPAAAASLVPFGKWRAGMLLGGAGLALLAVARLLATLWQAQGEESLRLASENPERRVELLEEARNGITRSLLLRPRRATAWLSLGSTLRLGRDPDGARTAFLRSFSLEERAETDLNVALVSGGRGDPQGATALFVRSVWVLPRLVDSLPEDVSAAAIQMEVDERERSLASGGSPPSLPPEVSAHGFFP